MEKAKSDTKRFGYPIVIGSATESTGFRNRVDEVPELDRIVVAIDPPVTGHVGSDECGIVVAGVKMSGPPQTWKSVVLEDATVAGASPSVWAEAAIAAMERHGADKLVAEVNQGGQMVAEVLRTSGKSVSGKD